MATKFDFKKSPDVNGTADKTTLYPKIVVAGTKNLENIADDIAKRSGFKAGTVIGLFSDLENLLTDYLAERAKWNWNAQTPHTASKHLLPSTLRKSDSAC